MPNDISNAKMEIKHQTPQCIYLEQAKPCVHPLFQANCHHVNYADRMTTMKDGSVNISNRVIVFRNRLVCFRKLATSNVE